MMTAGCGPLFHAASDETWPRQAVWLLGFVETLPATSQNQKTRGFPAWWLPLPETQKAGYACPAG